MAIYEVETEDGVFEVETDDSQETPLLDPALPNLESTENKIGKREDLLGSLINRVKGSFDPQAMLKNEVNTNPAVLELLGGATQRGEAMLANFGLSAQRGDSSSLIPELMKGAKGERLGQFGDLVRTTGVGGPWNEALASSAGFLATLGIDKILSGGTGVKTIEKGSEQITKGTGKVVSEAVDATSQAVKDAITKKTGFLDDVRSAFYDAKSSASDKYGEGLEKLAMDNPDKAVSLRPVVEQLSAEIAYEPKLRNAVNRIPGLASFLDDPKLADNVPLKEAQKIVNDLQSKISSSKLKGMGVRPDDMPLLDTIHDIKAQMVEAFPEIKELRKSYGETMNRFNLIRSKLRKGNLSKAVKDNFGDVEVEQEAKKLLESHPEIIARMRNYNLLRKVGTFSAGAMTGVAGLKGLDLLLKK